MANESAGMLTTFLATSILRLGSLYTIELWVKVAQIVQGFLTPVIAILIGVITSRIQRQQVKTQQQQAETSHLQHRLALMDRRMKVFDATQELIGIVFREARIEELDPLFQFMRDTRERHMLFGVEIGEYIDELYSKGLRLHTIHAASGPQHVMRPQDIPVNAEITEWFSRQSSVAKDKFLKYLDFREP